MTNPNCSGFHYPEQLQAWQEVEDAQRAATAARERHSPLWANVVAAAVTCGLLALLLLALGG
jgi:hypothetical protein